MFNKSVFLDYKLNCQKPAHFLSAEMALMSTFFQVFLVLEMYDFDSHHKSSVCRSLDPKLTIYLHMFLLLLFVKSIWLCLGMYVKKIVSSAYRLTIQVSGYHNNFPQDILLG